MIGTTTNFDTEPADMRELAVAAIGRMPSVPTLLKVLGDITGMGFVSIARVTNDSWTACAVRDGINFGLVPGAPLDVDTTLCKDVVSSGASIAIDHGSRHPAYRDHRTLALYNIESYIAVPIVMPDGEIFGTLCAIDPHPANVSDARILSMFKEFAQLIATELKAQLEHDRQSAALSDERALSELREQFIAILGHDLRNPLQALQAGCDVLAKRKTDEWTVALAARMKTNVRRMSLLIDDVLDFARGRLGGGIGVQLQTAEDIGAAIDAVARELQDSHPDRAILSDIRVGRPVRCDVGRIQQLVSNLLGNALVHGAGDAAVKLTAVADEEELLMTVWNDGEPILAENLDKIFSPFWRRETSANRDGLGLGLHICSQIVSAHQGVISVTSTREGGTKFTVRLPLALSRAADGNLAFALGAAEGAPGAGDGAAAGSPFEARSDRR